MFVYPRYSLWESVLLSFQTEKFQETKFLMDERVQRSKKKTFSSGKLKGTSRGCDWKTRALELQLNAH